MNPILLTPLDISVAASLIILDAVLSIWLKLRLHRQIAIAAAKWHLLVDLHGSPKPAGLQRTYPNVINFEAVRGEECSKWDTTSNPVYHLQIPFIRMLSGDLDYTPGSMRNRSRASFVPVPKGLPTTMGTRCHELALFILFDQYLAVLSDPTFLGALGTVVLYCLIYLPLLVIGALVLARLTTGKAQD